MKQKIKDLTKFINYHDYLYHELNTPKISDGEYDKAFAMLVKLESKYPEFRRDDTPTNKVGYPPVTNDVVEHMSKMYSMSNVFNEGELKEWLESLNLADKAIIYADLKLDGLAMRITYKDGHLSEAAKRGDGIKGGEVTSHALRIHNIPKVSSNHDTYEVRGEVVISQADFNELNRIRIEEEKTPYKTPRSAVAGLMNSKVIPMVANLRFIAYGSTLEDNYRSHSEMMDNLHKFYEFEIPPYITAWVDRLDNIIDFYKDISKVEFHDDLMWYDGLDLTLPVDGIVIKVDCFRTKESIGYTEKWPKAYTAWKFTDQNKVTKIEDIVYQVGRTGILSPVAIVKPVRVSGVVISNAQLFNERFITDKMFFIGNVVGVERRGGVKPALTHFVTTTSSTKKFHPITHCPICGEKVIVVNKEKMIKKCINGSCIGIRRARFEYFLSRNGLDIQGFGGKRIEKLLDEANWMNLDDVFNTTKETYTELFGDKIGTQLYDNIQSKVKELQDNRGVYQLIAAIGIPGLSKKMIESWIESVSTIEEMIESIKDVKKLHEAKLTSNAIGCILSYFSDHPDELKRLNEAINI